VLGKRCGHGFDPQSWSAIPGPAPASDRRGRPRNLTSCKMVASMLRCSRKMVEPDMRYSREARRARLIRRTGRTTMNLMEPRGATWS
jgi:hypothetical protein